MRARMDLKGRRFGRLVAVADVGADKYGRRLHHCECDCGGYVKVPTQNLVSGSTRSCGCLFRDTRSVRGLPPIEHVLGPEDM